MKAKKNFYILLGLLATFFATPAWAQTAEGGSSMTQQDILMMVVLSMVLIVAILVLVVAIYMVRVMKLIINEEKKQKAIDAGEEYLEEEVESWWSKTSKSLTDAVPVEQEEEILLDHDYDGIKELDNHLPPWWKALFYITIVWSIGYLLVYHVFDTFPLQEEAYEQEMTRAQEEVDAYLATLDNLIDETNAEFSDNNVHLANGKKIFDGNCAACHLNDGGGKNGPNLTDDYWLHGGGFRDIFYTIKYGVPQKGMISWQTKLSPADMRDVASYIYTMHGTTPANPKAPEGEFYQRGEEQQEADTTAVALR